MQLFPNAPLLGVMAERVPAIHVVLAESPAKRTWMPTKTGTPPRYPAAGCLYAGMTLEM
jgi:hypothetical protein